MRAGRARSRDPLVKLPDSKDFWSGVMLIAIGAVAVFIARDYPFGTIGSHVVGEGMPGAVRISGQVFDGAGEPVPDAMIETWAELPAQFIFTAFDVSHRSAMQPHMLANIAASKGLTSRAVSDPVEALSVARRVAGADDLVVVTGSTFLVATLRDWFLENAGAQWHAQV